MQFPKPRTNTYRLLQALYRHGPFTMEEGMKIHLHFGEGKRTTYETYRLAFERGYIEKEGEVYSLAIHVKKHLDQCQVTPKAKKADNVVPSREPAPFRPWSQPKHPRAGELRDISFKTGSISYEPFRLRFA